MNKEIGGYFEFEKLISNEYHKDLISVNTARNAILLLIKSKEYKKVFIPYLLCDCIENVLKKNNIDFEFYNVDNKFIPLLKNELDENEAILIVNFYGLLSNALIINLKNKYKNIILDNTHDFYRKPIEGIDTVYNCRKFFGVTDGAYLSTNIEIKNNYESDYSRHRFTHLFGRYEVNASEFYSDFRKVDDGFDNEPIKWMSKLTKNIMGAIDYEFIKKQRIKNFNILKISLDDINILDVNVESVPFSYPLYLKNGKEIRKKLAEKKIFIPTLWPNVLEINQDLENDYAENILPIPCDQRYKEDDMKYIIEELLKCLN